MPIPQARPLPLMIALDGESSDETVDVDADSSDDIVNNVNDSILGDDVIQSSTEDPAS